MLCDQWFILLFENHSIGWLASSWVYLVIHRKCSFWKCLCPVTTAAGILNPRLQFTFQGAVVLFDYALCLQMSWSAIKYFNSIFFNNQSTVSLNSVPLSHCNMCCGPNKPIHSASFSAASTACLPLRAKLLENLKSNRQYAKSTCIRHLGLLTYPISRFEYAKIINWL